jgi:polyhydroxybutyrate depolymerase
LRELSEAAAPASLEELRLSVGGTQRSALLHERQGGVVPAAGRPLVVMLHGAGATARIAAQQTRWIERADAAAAAVVFPEGVARDPQAAPQFRLNPQAWNDGSGRGHPARLGIDDVGFIAALIEAAAARLPLDRSRVYVTGFSNGASLAFRVAAELSDRVAAAVAVAGHCWIEPPLLARPVPLLYVMGGADPLNPLDGGEVDTPWGQREYHPPLARSVARWRAAIGATSPGYLLRAVDGIREERHDGLAGAELRVLTLVQMGHVWPGGPRLLPERIVGRRTDVVDATDLAWSFLSRFALPPRHSH